MSPTERTLGWLLLGLALGVRCGYWSLVREAPSEAFYNYHLVQGAPYADAYFWDRLAGRLAEGHSLAGSGWEARRPIYAYLLAIFYAWTGPAYAVAQGLNIVASTATVWLIYDLARRMFGLPAGIAAGVWLTFHQESLSLCLITLTETIGLLLTIWHLRELVRGFTGETRHFLTSGLLFAASNLTRTLSLLALPGYVVAVLLTRWRSGVGGRVAWWSACWFGVGATALLAPFMAQQWLRHGVFTLSNNSAGDLFAATSPHYQQWSFDVEKLAVDAGKQTIREKYEFFMAGARENLRRYPGFYASNVRRTLTRAWGELLRQEVLGGWASIAAVFAAAMLPGCWARSTGQWLPFVWVLGIAAVVIAIERWLPGGTVAPLVVLALLRALMLRRGDTSLLLVVYFVGTLAAVGMFAAVEARLTLFVQWALTLLYLGGLATLTRVVDLGAPSASLPPAVPEPSHGWAALPARRQRQWASVCALLVAPLACRQTFWPAADHAVHELSIPLAVDAVLHAYRAEPDFFTPDEQAVLQRWQAISNAKSTTGAAEFDASAFNIAAIDEPEFRRLIYCGEAEHSDGRLFVVRGCFDRVRYEFAAHEATQHLSPVFARREYPYGILHLEGYDATGKNWFLKVVLPDDWRPRSKPTEYVVIARGNAALREYVNPTGETLAVIPVEEHRLQPGQEHVCNTLAHRRLVAGCATSTSETP